MTGTPPVTEAAAMTGTSPVTEAAVMTGTPPVTEAAAMTGTSPVTEAAVMTGTSPVTDVVTSTDGVVMTGVTAANDVGTDRESDVEAETAGTADVTESAAGMAETALSVRLVNALRAASVVGIATAIAGELEATAVEELSVVTVAGVAEDLL